MKFIYDVPLNNLLIHMRFYSVFDQQIADKITILNSCQKNKKCFWGDFDTQKKMNYVSLIINMYVYFSLKNRENKKIKRIKNILK
jgi:hypothetical protein